jgi:iron(III) transport system substrate-binding protein
VSVGSRLICLLAAVLLVACGDSENGDDKTGFEKVLSQVNERRGKERTRALARLAQREGGSLEFYTSLQSDDAAELAGEFEDEYDIEVSVYRASSETVAQRVNEEARADFRGADVVETNGLEMRTLATEGVLAPYRSPHAARLVEGSRQEGWTVDRFNKFVVSWNTKLVPRGSQPRSWEDLADPRWKGKLAMEADDIDWYKTLRDHWVRGGKSPEEADRLFERMARNASVLKGHSLMAELLAAGEYAVAASNFTYQLEEDIDDGAPVAWRPPVEPIVSRPNGVGLVRQARHPATAVLFVDWLLSDGQRVLRESKLDPARRDLATAPTTREIQVDVGALAAQAEEWKDRYDRLVGLGKKVEAEE